MVKKAKQEPVKKALEEKQYSDQQRKQAGSKGKEGSPWKQFNPGWLKRSAKSSKNISQAPCD